MPRFSIVGQKWLKLDPHLPGTLAGCEVELVREPNNEHDAFAVAVWIDGKKVGYLGKRDNVQIAKRIDATGVAWVPPPGASNLALDTGREVRPFLKAKFARSPNTSYPQVEIDL